jgi:hypothetical protein
MKSVGWKDHSIAPHKSRDLQEDSSMHDTPSALPTHAARQTEPEAFRIRIADSLFLIGDSLGLFVNLENGSSIFLIKVGNFYCHTL